MKPREAVAVGFLRAAAARSAERSEEVAEQRAALCTPAATLWRSGSGCLWRTCTACRSYRSGAAPSRTCPRRRSRPQPSRRAARLPRQLLPRSPDSRLLRPPLPRQPPLRPSRWPPRSPRSPSTPAPSSSRSVALPTDGRPRHRLGIARRSSRCREAPSRLDPSAPWRMPSGILQPRWEGCPISASSAWRDLHPCLRTRLNTRVVSLRAGTVVPIRLRRRRRLGRRRRQRRLLGVNRRLFNDDQRRRVDVVRRRIIPVRIRRAPPECGPDADEDVAPDAALPLPCIARHRSNEKQRDRQKRNQH